MDVEQDEKDLYDINSHPTVQALISCSIQIADTLPILYQHRNNIRLAKRVQEKLAQHEQIISIVKTRIGRWLRDESEERDGIKAIQLALEKLVSNA